MKITKSMIIGTMYYFWNEQLYIISTVAILLAWYTNEENINTCCNSDPYIILILYQNSSRCLKTISRTWVYLMSQLTPRLWRHLLQLHWNTVAAVVIAREADGLKTLSQSHCTALTAGNLPAVSAVQETVGGLWKKTMGIPTGQLTQNAVEL